MFLKMRLHVAPVVLVIVRAIVALQSNQLGKFRAGLGASCIAFGHLALFLSGDSLRGSPAFAPFGFALLDGGHCIRIPLRNHDAGKR